MTSDVGGFAKLILGGACLIIGWVLSIALSIYFGVEIFHFNNHDYTTPFIIALVVFSIISGVFVYFLRSSSD